MTVVELVAGNVDHRFGIGQVVEHKDCIALREHSIIAQTLVEPILNAGSGNMDIRIALLEWWGDADTLDRDVVADWDNGTFVIDEFFSASYVLLGTAKVTATHRSWTQLSIVGEVSPECNNLVVMVWKEVAADHAADKLRITEAGSYEGQVLQEWLPRPTGLEETLCQRYCYSPKPQLIGFGRAISTTVAEIFLTLPTRMRAIPTLDARISAADWGLADGVNTPTTPTDIVLGADVSEDAVTLLCTVDSGLTQFRTYTMIQDGSDKKMFLDAEI